LVSRETCVSEVTSRSTTPQPGLSTGQPMLAIYTSLPASLSLSASGALVVKYTFEPSSEAPAKSALGRLAAPSQGTSPDALLATHPGSRGLEISSVFEPPRRTNSWCGLLGTDSLPLTQTVKNTSPPSVLTALKTLPLTGAYIWSPILESHSRLSSFALPSLFRPTSANDFGLPSQPRSNS